MRRTGLFGISKEDLLEWIRNSNYCDNDKLTEEIGSDNINKEKDAKYNLIDIINGSPIGNVTDGAVTDTNKVYKTFEELPKDIILDVNAGSKNGVEWLIGKYKRYYSKKRKQALFDLDLKKEGEVRKLIEDIKRFCQQFANYEEIKNFIDGVGKENEERSKGRKKWRNVRFGFLIVLLGLGLGSLSYNLIKGFEDEAAQILATVCGILDFICGIVFFIHEKREDEEEKEREEKISNAQSELFAAVKEARTAAMLSNEAAQLTSKLGDTLSSTTDKLNSTLTSTLCQTSKINENLNATIDETSKANTELGTILQELTKKTEKAKKELEIERENLGICVQCHVPLGQVCNICGHKYSTPLPREEENVYIQKKSDEFGYRVIQVDNVAILVCDAEKINLSNILKMSGNDDVDDSHRIRSKNVSWVKRIVFTSAVQNIVLDDNGSIDSLKSLFPGVNIVGFAKPENGLKQYHLGKNVFNKMNDIEIRGLEYIAAGDAGCFGSWKREDIKTINPSLNNICFK